MTERSRTWTGRVFIAVSLDGYIARSDSDITWLTDPPPGRGHVDIASSHRAQTWDTFIPAIDHIVMGRGTYEKACSFPEWPYNGQAVIVLSTTLPTTDRRITIARTLHETLTALTTYRARQVYIDGGQIVQHFLRAGLIDEMTITTAPVLIGAGIRLFGDTDTDVHLTLLANHTSAGMVHTTYKIDRF